MAADPPAELVRRTLSGDREAFAVLYDRFAPLVRAVVRDADATQDTFLRAYRNLRTLSDPGRFAGWLVGIARQVARERHRLRPIEPLTADPPTHDSPSADDADEVAHLLELVARLPADEREAVRLFFLCERDADDTAKRLGRSRSGTYALLKRAVGTLAGWMGVPQTEGGR